jgi:hypothetical protein
MVRQCTRCDLRFRSEAELREHLEIDHHADTSVLERYRYTSSRPQEPLYDDLDIATRRPHRILVIANQTLGSAALTEEIVRRVADTPTEVVVVVPATHSADYPPADGDVDAEITPRSDERGAAQARWRLRQVLEGLHELGVDAAGQLGAPDPYAAAGALLEDEEFDEVVMSTLPAGLSRWFSLDVPARIRRRFGVPVTTVTGEPSTPLHA